MNSKDIVTPGSFNSIIIYRTKDNSADYKFDIQPHSGDGYRIYIESQPSYNGRDSGGHPTHRYTDSAGRRYICWPHRISSYEKAKEITATWSECTQKYIRTGTEFKDQ
jgi:hypothetical protein